MNYELLGICFVHFRFHWL